MYIRRHALVQLLTGGGGTRSPLSVLMLNISIPCCSCHEHEAADGTNMHAVDML